MSTDVFSILLLGICIMLLLEACDREAPGEEIEVVLSDTQPFKVGAEEKRDLDESIR